MQLAPGDLKSHAVVEMTNLLMEEPIFDRLRTQEQLGYQVFSMFRNTYGVLGVSVTICSQVGPICS
jgi:nardilysin